jgi:hypothetical protein
MREWLPQRYAHQRLWRLPPVATIMLVIASEGEQAKRREW